MTGNTSYV